MTARKRVVIVLMSRDRAPEGLRAAVGLMLRGDHVDVVPRVVLDDHDPRVAKARATLRLVGGNPSAELSAIRTADCVEVWS